MRLSGERTIAASREDVWAGLNDPQTLRLCILGCISVDRASPREYLIKSLVNVGPISATFDGTVTLSDVDPPSSLRLRAVGRSPAAGFASGEILVSLAAIGESTSIRYEGTATVGGRLAQIGARLVDLAAQGVIGTFFDRLEAMLARPAGRLDEEPGRGAAPEPGIGHDRDADGRARPGLAPVVWVPGLLLVIALVLVFAARL